MASEASHKCCAKVLLLKQKDSNCIHTCARGGEVGVSSPPLRGAPPPQRFSTSLVRDVTQKKKFPALYPPLRKIFSPRPIPPLKIFFCYPPYSPSWKFDLSLAYSPLSRNNLANSLPTSPPTSLPTSPISEIKIHISLLYFLFPRPHPPPEFFFVVPHAYPPPENFRKMWSEKFSPCPIPPSRNFFFLPAHIPPRNFGLTSPSMEFFRAQVCN